MPDFSPAAAILIRTGMACHVFDAPGRVAFTHVTDAIAPGIYLFLAKMLSIIFSLNLLLFTFNLLPIPPLDGGRILVGLLPDGLSRALASLESYGMMLVIVALLVLPLLGPQIGLDLNFV